MKFEKKTGFQKDTTCFISWFKKVVEFIMNSTNKVGILEENHPVDIKDDDSQANIQGGFYHI